MSVGCDPGFSRTHAAGGGEGALRADGGIGARADAWATSEACGVRLPSGAEGAPAAGGVRGFHPDPRTKLALLFIWALAVFFSPGLWFEMGMMALAAAFGVACGKGRLSLGMLALYAVLMLAASVVTQLDAGIFKTLISSFFMLVRKVFPCGLLAAVIVSTTHVNELLSALSRMRVPRSLTIPLAVMLRYAPAIREDWRFVSDAMRMRGVSPSLGGFLRRPATTVECVYVPLLMNASNVADELCMASVVRGIENPAPRTCYTHIEMRAVDGVLLAAGLTVLACACAFSLAGVSPFD